jgi:hypothetical protein
MEDMLLEEFVRRTEAAAGPSPPKRRPSGERGVPSLELVDLRTAAEMKLERKEGARRNKTLAGSLMPEAVVVVIG